METSIFEHHSLLFDNFTLINILYFHQKHETFLTLNFISIFEKKFKKIPHE